MFEKVLRSVALVGAVLIAASVFAQDKLSGRDQKWMEKEVGPLITEQEKAMFQQIDKDDRNLFKELFWLRRDHDPTTPENEFREAYEKGVEYADGRFGSDRSKGSESEYGEVFLLLGTPDYEQRSGGGNLTRLDWRYEPNAALGIPDGLTVRFRPAGQIGHRIDDEESVREALERVKESHIANRAVDYARDDNGRLRKPDPGRPGGTPEQLLKVLVDTGATSDAIPFEVNTAFFQASEGEVYVPMDIVFGEGFSGGHTTIFYELHDAGGISLSRFEQAVDPTEGARGHLGVELPIMKQVTPGAYKLYIGVLDDSQTLGSKIVDIEAPNFADGEFKLSSIVMFSKAEKTGEVKGALGEAFMFGGYHFYPKRELVYTHENQLAGVFNAYNYGLDNGQPNLTFQASFFREGKALGMTAEKPFSLQSPTVALTIVALPLNIAHVKEPGNYTLKIKVTDHTNQKVLTEEVDFVIE